MKSSINTFIEEVLADIILFGLEKKVTVFYNRGTRAFVDYALENETVDYINEKKQKLNLFELLNYLIAIEMKDNFSPECCLIKAARLILNFSQSQFANAVGVTAQVVQSWDMGSCIPKTDVAVKCAEFLGCSSDLFFSTYNMIKKLL